ncbi:MAG TPA: Smr/MutS family protein, partial [Pyrinomonadaceae bacterium]
AELKREAQRAARAAVGSTTPQQPATTPARSIRVVRDGRVVNAPDAQPAVEEDYRVSTSRPIVVGDRVRLRSFGSVGIVDKISGDEAEVRVKALRFRERLSNLDLVEAAEPKSEMGRLMKMQAQAKRATEVRLSTSETEARAELNVIGRTTDEAVEETDKFLDEAYLNSLHHIRIIHGHGTGALRKAISDFLRNHPHVARFSQAPQDQGGTGATLVELKQ